MATAEPIQLVVGLGNPGAGHCDDRHNAGFWLVERLASDLNAEFREEQRFKGELARSASGVRILKPQTFMNLSGESVAPCAKYFRIPPSSIVVVHDELDLVPGELRLKRGGGHGGHNGLRSIDSLLGSNAYLRVRIGIGHPGHARDVSPYVLSKPARAEREAIDDVIDSVIKNFKLIAAGEFDRAMNTLNRRSKQP